jgi:hypothetical protein
LTGHSTPHPITDNKMSTWINDNHNSKIYDNSSLLFFNSAFIIEN